MDEKSFITLAPEFRIRDRRLYGNGTRRSLPSDGRTGFDGQTGSFEIKRNQIRQVACHQK
jgi:hypothetical protein